MSFFSGSSRSKFQSAVYSVLLLAFFFAVGLAGGILYRELPSSKTPGAPETKVAEDTATNPSAATQDQQSAAAASAAAPTAPTKPPSVAAVTPAAPMPDAAPAPTVTAKTKPVAREATPPRQRLAEEKPPETKTETKEATPSPPPRKETKATEAKPVETKPAESKPAETKSGEAKEMPEPARAPAEGTPAHKLAEAEAPAKSPTQAKAVPAPNAAKATPAAQAPAPTPKKQPTQVAKASPQPASTDTPPFRIQFGAFAIEDNAHRTQWAVEATGMPVEITRAPSRKGRLLYFVWSHPFATRAAAEAAAVAARDKARKFTHPVKIEYVVLNDALIAAEQGKPAQAQTQTP